jgi:tRNA(fMet)-specific endonuclease VapC
MYLLDTNYCSKLLNKDPVILDKLETLGDTYLSICVIVQGELVFMAHNSERRKENLLKVQDFLDDVDVYPVDARTADIYGELKAGFFKKYGPKEKKLRRKTKIYNIGIDDNDLWIAAVAKRNGLIIISEDQGFQRIEKVDAAIIVEKW